MKRIMLIGLVLLVRNMACQTVTVVEEPDLTGVQEETPQIADSEPAAVSTAAPIETSAPLEEPMPTEANLGAVLGIWQGTSQWLCDDNPVWQTTLDFQPGGVVVGTLASDFETSTASVPYDLSGNSIEIDFNGTLWVGTVDGDQIGGSFDSPGCPGLWSVTRQ